MIALLDTHVHFYPCFDLTRALEAAWRNFEAIGKQIDGDSRRVLYLTERADCQVFRALCEQPETLVSAERFTLQPTADPEVLRVERLAGGELFLVAGRQIATAERLEVLALHTLNEFEDGRAISESINRACAANAVVVLNWSLGKWMFGRGRTVEAILARAQPDDFAIGDIAARPLGWGEPKLVELGRERGLLPVAGSDPLPFSGEELRIGSYVSCIEISRAQGAGPGFFRDILRDRTAMRKIVGRRNTPWVAGMRLWRNSLSKRQGFPPCCV